MLLPLGLFPNKNKALKRLRRLVQRRQTRLDGQSHRLGHVLRLVCEAVLEVRRDRQLDGPSDRARVREGLIARHRSIQARERRGEAAARRSQRLEACGGEQRGRACVPWVG